MRRSRSGRRRRLESFEVSDQGAGVRRSEVDRDDQGGEEDYIVREGEQGYVRRRHRSRRRHPGFDSGGARGEVVKVGEARREGGQSVDVRVEVCFDSASAGALAWRFSRRPSSG